MNFSGVTKDVGPRGPTDEEIEASLNAAEEKRRERFENMEEERESMRQVIRDKVSPRVVNLSSSET